MDDFWKNDPIVGASGAAPAAAPEAAFDPIAGNVASMLSRRAKPAPAPAEDAFWLNDPVVGAMPEKASMPPARPPQAELDTGMNVPEPPKTIAAQQAQVGKGTGTGQRSAVMFPTGSQEPDLPEDWARVVTPRGVFHYDPSKVRGAKIRELSEQGKENEILGLGPVSKPEADARVAKGEPPVTVVERQPDGTEVKAAVGTPSTVAQQAAALEKGKLPGSTVGVEQPLDTAWKRLAQNPPIPPARPADIGEQPQPFGPEQPQMFEPEQPLAPTQFVEPLGFDIDPAVQAARDNTRQVNKDGTTFGMLTPAEGRKEFDARIASAEAELVAADERLKVAEERAKLLAGRPAPRRGSQAEQQKNVIETEYANATDARIAARKALDAAKALPAPSMTALRSRLEGAAKSALDMPVGALGGVGRPIDAVLGTDIGGRADRERARTEASFKGDVARAGEFGQELSEGAGSMVGFIMGGAIGRAAGLSQKTTSMALGGFQNADEMYREAEKAGATGWKKAAAYIAGGAVGLTEGFGSGRLLDHLAGVDKATNGGVRRYFGLILQQKGEEGLQEAVQSLGNDFAKLGILGIDPGDMTENALKNAFMGAILGGATAAVLGSPMALSGRGLRPEDAIGDLPKVGDVPLQFGAGFQYGQPLEPARDPVQPQEDVPGAAPAPAASETTPQPDIGSTPMSEAASSPLGTGEGAAPSSSVPAPADGTADERILKAAGYSDEDIADMSPAMIASEVASARDEGIEDPGPSENAAPSQLAADLVVGGADLAANGAQSEAGSVQGDGAVNVPPDFADGSASSNAAGSQSAPDSLVGGPNLSSNIRHADAVLSKGYGSLDIPSRAAVFEDVVAALNDEQVFRRVVSSIPVDMMNVLAAKRFAPEDLRSNRAMFIRALTPDRNLFVGGRAIDAVVRALAGQVAESAPHDLAGRPVKGGVAGQADKGDWQNQTSEVVSDDATKDRQPQAAPAPASEFTPIAQAQPGDMIEKGRELVERGLSRSGAVKLAKNTKGAKIVPDGRKWAVIAPPERAKDRTGRTSTRDKNGKPLTLVAFLRANGGIKDESGELRARDLHRKHPGLVNNKGGMTLEEAREMAAEAGYIAPDGPTGDLSYTDAAVATTTPSDLLNAIDGHPSYSVFDDAEVAASQESGAAADYARRIDEVKADLRSDLLALPGVAEWMIEDRILALAAEFVVADGTGDLISAYENAAVLYYRDVIDAEETRPNEQEIEWLRLEAPPFSEDEVRARAAAGADGDGNPQAAAGDQENDGPGGSVRGQGDDLAADDAAAAQEEDQPGRGNAGEVADREADGLDYARTMERAIDAIEAAVESDDRDAVAAAAREAKRVLAGIPQSEKDADPEYWGQFPPQIQRMTKPGYATATQQAESKKPAKPTTEKGADGKDQLVVPGAEKIGDGKLAQMKADAPLKAKAPQKDVGGLFSDAKDELDMFADAPKAEQQAIRDGELPVADDRERQRLENIKKLEAIEAENALAPEPMTKAEIEAVVQDRIGSGYVVNITPGGRVHIFKKGTKSGALTTGTLNDRTEILEHIEGVRAFLKSEGLLDAPAAKPAVPFSGNPTVEAFRHRLASPEGGFKNIFEARRFAAENGFVAQGEVPENKQIEEMIELALVLAARDVIAASKARGPLVTYQRLVDLYARQPKLGTRTSASVAEQAYSTPVPLAYLASRLAGVDRSKTVLEPTAGNGALLIEADPKKASVNELNPARADNLTEQGFRVSREDATTAKLRHAGYPVDVVIANPPFGAVREGGQSKVWQLGDYRTSAIDHIISLRALEAMADGGRAVLIIGGVKATDPKERAAGYMSQQKRKFFFQLMSQYNVTDIFTVDGGLYERQGAAWPVDVIVIEGKGASTRKPPTADVPKLYTSWEALKEKFDGRSAEPSQSAGVAGQDGRPAAGPAETGIGPDSGDGLGGSPANGGGIPAPFALAANGPVQLDAEPSGGESDDLLGEQGAGARAGEDRPDGVRDGGGVDTGADPDGVGDLNALFETILAEEFASDPSAIVPPPKPPRTRPNPPRKPSAKKPAAAPTAAQSAASAVQNTAMGLDQALSGLNALFNDPSRMGSGPVFDEDTYAKAKPFFLAAVQHFANAATDVAAMMRSVIQELRDKMKWGMEAIQRAQPYVVRFINDVKAGRISLTQEKADDVQMPEQGIGAGQSPYVPASKKGAPLNTLVPTNQQASTRDSLRRVEERQGSVDEFVAKELGYDVNTLGDYFSAEQVDAIALAIDNIQKGSGFIIGDQTGIGKGRVVAAAIRYAHKKGMVPLFVTEKPDLYGDMWRDLHDIGFDKYLGRPIEMFMTNSGTSVPLDEDAVSWIAERDAAKDAGERLPPKRGRFSTPQDTKKAAQRMDEIRNGSFKPDVVFTTYDQMNSVKGQETPRRNFLRAIASRSFLIMDETHNAGGQGQDARVDSDKAAPRAVVFREAVGRAQAVLYSSATYAKSPKVMDLFARTDMAFAVDEPKELGKLIATGGIPLQQAVSAMLSKAGQYIRRERSFDGITYDMESAPVDLEAYGRFTDGLRRVFRFDKSFSDERKEIAEQMAAEILGAGTAADGAVGDTGAQATEFASVMHNAINQMILSIKADAAADRAIASLRAGEKPVIALSSTMESFITDFAEDADIKIGDQIPLDFGDVIKRYLKRALRITIKMPDDTKMRVFIPLERLSPEAQDSFRAVESFLNDLDFQNLPISPIDWIRNRIAKAGFSVKEITGRKQLLDYGQGNAPIYSNRPNGEQGVGGKRVSIQEFNNGKLDVLILNRSGSTGVSLHAKKGLKDVRKRRMILVQADPNIDVHMQMLGRTNRTGQVVLPAYTQLMADIPAEARPAAVLLKKMASLNANTTAARKSALSGDTVDFINDYGDQVVGTILGGDPELNMALGWPLSDGDGSKLIQGLAAKATGKLALLDPPQQQEFLDAVTEAYTQLVATLDAAGENKLEAKSVDLQAISEETTVLKPASGPSPFQSEVTLEKVSAKAQGRAMAPGEVLEAVREAIGLHTVPEGNFPWALTQMKAEGRARNKALIEKTRAEFIEHKKHVLSTIKDAGAKTKAAEKLDAEWSRWTSMAQDMAIGQTITFETEAGGNDAVVIGFSKSSKAKSPIALSGWQVTFAIPDSARSVGMPLSQVYTDLHPKPEESAGITINANDNIDLADLEGRFEEARKEGREARYIVTGNILAGYEQMSGQGRIINYTTADGAVRQGILLGRKFDPATFFRGKGVRLKTADHVLAFLNQVPEGEVSDKKGVITVRVVNDYRRGRGIEFDLPAAKAKGGVYYTDRTVRAVFDAWQRSGSRMRALLGESRAKQMLDAMMALDAVFEASTHQDVARAITGEQAPTAQQSPSAEPAPTGINGSNILKAINSLPTGRGRAMASARAQDESPLTDDEMREFGLTPAALSAGLDEAHITNIVRDIVEKVAGPRAAVQMTAGDMDIGGLAASGGWFSGEAVVRVALDASHKREVAYHEAWHALQSFGAFSAEETALLEREAGRHRAMVQAAWMKRAGRPFPVDLPVGETSAYAFGYYAHLRDTGVPVTQFHIGARRAFEKALEILRRIRNYFEGLGFQTSEDIFARAMSGEFRNAEGRGISWDAPQVAARLWNEGDGARAMASPKLAQRERGNTGRAVEYIADRFVRIRELQNQFMKDSGIRNVPDVHRALGAIDTRIAARVEDMVSDEVNPLLKLIEAAGGEERVHRFLYVSHAEERNDHVASFNPAMPDGGSGIDTLTAQLELSIFRASPDYGALQAAANAVYAMIERDLQEREAAGLYNNQQTTDLRNLFSNYVPLRGFESDEYMPGLPQAGVGLSVTRRESPIVKGRKSLADSIIAQTINLRVDGIARAQKNRVDLMLYRLAQMMEQHYGPGRSLLKARNKPPMIRTGGSGSVVKSIPDPSYGQKPSDPVVTAKLDGKPRWVEFVGEPELLDQMKNAVLEQDDVARNWIGAMTRAIGQLWTTYNPLFPLRNTSRDYLDASVAASALIGTKGVALYNKNLPGAHKEAINYLRGQESPEFHRFRLAGGKMSWATLRNLEQIERKIADELNGLQFSNARRKAFGFVLGVLEHWNDLFETAHRFALYKAALQVGLPEAQAVKAALEGTMNFNRRGRGDAIRWLRILWPFMNPSLQAPLRASRLIQEAGGLGTAQGKKVAAIAFVRGLTKTYLAFTVLGFALGAWNYAYGGDDEEDKIPWWDKARAGYQVEKNIVIYAGRDEKGRPKAIMIPAFAEITFPIAMGNALASMIWGKRSRGDIAKDIGGAAYQLSPTHGRGVIPGVLAPLSEIYNNRNAFGQPVHRNDSAQTRGVPNPEQKFSSTAPFWQDVARAFGAATGGDNKTPGLVNLHPEDIRHIVRSYTGAYYQIAEQMASVAGIAPDDKTNILARPFFATGQQLHDPYERKKFEEAEGKANAERAAIRASVENPEIVGKRAEAQNVVNNAGKIREQGGIVGPQGGIRTAQSEIFDTGRKVMSSIARQRDAAIAKATTGAAKAEVRKAYSEKLSSERARFRRMSDDLASGKIKPDALRVQLGRERSLADNPRP